MDGKRRKEVQAELVSQGYAIDYLQTWPSKVDLYRHKSGLNTDGTECFPIGAKVPNQPGHPDHAARKSRLGMLPWPPGPACKCRACRERNAATAVVVLEAKVEETPAPLYVKEQAPVQGPLSRRCLLCSFVGHSTTPAGLASAMSRHRASDHSSKKQLVATPA